MTNGVISTTKNAFMIGEPGVGELELPGFDHRRSPA